MNLDADRFLQDLTGRYARLYTESIQDMVVAMAMGNKPALAAARKQLEAVMSETMGTAEVLGATLALRRAAALLTDEGMALKAEIPYLLAFADAPTQTILPRVTFEEAVQDMVDRTPVTIRRAAERTAQRISEIYKIGTTLKTPAVAFVRSAEAAVTDRVQSLITQAIKEGIPEASAGRLIRLGADEVRKRTAAWTEGYARMAFRTNLNTAVTAGRFRQAQDPDIKAVVPAFQFDSVGDADTRHNHDAADGTIMKVDNPEWRKLAPPLGYNSFVPGTRVAGHADTASEASYSGPVVTLKTGKGRWLTITPNHPILTSERGFTAAGDIRKGDHLVRHSPTIESLIHCARDEILSPPEILRRAVNDQQVIPRIEDVFRAARMQGARPAVEGLSRPLSLDFHGDAGFYKGEVHIVSLDLLLPDDRSLAELTAQRAYEYMLMPSPWTPGLLAHGSSLAMASRGGPCLLGSTPNIDPSGLEPFVDDTSRGACLLGELQDGFTSEIAFDEVIDIEITSYSGHVYDLQSPLGWIVANGYVASNCRCTLRFVGLPELRRMNRVTPEGDIREDKIPSGAFPDRGFGHSGRPDLSMTGR